MRKKLALFAVVMLLLCVLLGGNAFFGFIERFADTGTATQGADEKKQTALAQTGAEYPAPGTAPYETASNGTAMSGGTGGAGYNGDTGDSGAAWSGAALADTGGAESREQEPWMQMPGGAEPGAIKTVNIAGEDDGPEIIEIVISAAGDCTLGGDIRLGPNGFMQELQRQDNNYRYFLKNVYPIFRKDDLTIANMEGTFASAGPHKSNEFIISGPPELVEVFTSSGVDVVTIANNHTMDYLQKGYDETVAVLDEAGLPYFGNEYTALIDVKGIKIGLFGYSMPQAGADKDKITKNISRLREEGADIVIAYYHWGIEREYYPNANQKAIARHTIDSGADLVLGAHPHVLQGIEEYKGKNIVYSLGNFCFGANRNPFDKDTMIYQHSFVFSEGELIESRYRIIPCSISSVKDRNNYQPTPLEGAEAERVLTKLEQLSSTLY